jgi:hypothetical protein
MKTIFHPTELRGHADHGWLNAHHSFSFAGWYDPSRVHFGMLRVLNDDIVAGGQGFGLHPHNDMEIITIILEGAIEHKDNMGNGSVIRPGDVQVMSAGTGVFHSEFNPQPDQATNLFQLWIFPKEKGIAPRYDQKSFDPADRKGRFQLVASGFRKNGELYIHQDAGISLGDVKAGQSITYSLHQPGNGAYIMLIDGEVAIGDQAMRRRDAIGVWEAEAVTIQAQADSKLMVVEVPMR